MAYNTSNDYTDGQDPWNDDGQGAFPPLGGAFVNTAQPPVGPGYGGAVGPNGANGPPPGQPAPGYVWVQTPNGWNQVLIPAGQPGSTQPGPGTPTPTGAPGGGGGSTGGGGQTTGPILPSGSIGSLLTPYSGTPPSYVQPNDTVVNLPQGPAFPTLPAFNAPTAEEAAQFPGYQFALDQGQKAMERGAAARGVTNTGGSLIDAINYGQQAATQNYQNVYNADKDIYNTNLQSQYLAPYQAAYNNWSQTLPASQTAAGNQNSFNWNNYLSGLGQSNWQKQFDYNSLYGLTSLGAGAQ